MFNSRKIDVVLLNYAWIKRVQVVTHRNSCPTMTSESLKIATRAGSEDKGGGSKGASLLRRLAQQHPSVLQNQSLALSLVLFSKLGENLSRGQTKVRTVHLSFSGGVGSS